MSTHGRTRRTWLSVEAFTEQTFEDMRPSPKTHTVRFGGYAVSVTPTRRRRVLDRQAWTTIRGCDGSWLFFTPFGELDIDYDVPEFSAWSEVGDIPRDARRPTPEEQAAWDAETALIVPCDGCGHDAVAHIASDDYDPERAAWPCHECGCGDLAPRVPDRHAAWRATR